MRLSWYAPMSPVLSPFSVVSDGSELDVVNRECIVSIVCVSITPRHGLPTARGTESVLVLFKIFYSNSFKSLILPG